MRSTMHVSGKLPGRPSVAAAVGHHPTLLLYARDRFSGRRFLVDTGAFSLPLAVINFHKLRDPNLLLPMGVAFAPMALDLFY
jgi:hypothetical protein